MKVKTLALSSLFLIVLIACLQIPVAMAIMPPLPPAPPPATALWWDPTVGTNDIALSGDGQYVVVASSSGVIFYNRTSETPTKTPMWTYSDGGAFFSVAISADGDCVAAGNGTASSGCVFFWKNARSLTGTPDPTWIGKNMWGRIECRALAISDDGNYVAACGTGPGVYYWADAKMKSGNDVQMTWYAIFTLIIEAVDISSDGDYVVAGTEVDPESGHAKVLYWKNARSLGPGSVSPAWLSTYPDDYIVDVAVSDDGNYVAAAGMLGVSPVYYWANAKILSGDPATTWESASGVDFSSIDMSSDGDKVIAGGLGPPGDQGVYFWAGARGRSGTQPWSWRYTTEGSVHDVAINDAGDYMAAANDMATPYVYFFDNKGDLKWRYGPLDHEVKVISISSDGGTLAFGTEAIATSYLVSTGYRTVARAVGGFLLPADKLTLLTPWVAVALAAVAATVFAKKRRRS